MAELLALRLEGATTPEGLVESTKDEPMERQEDYVPTGQEDRYHHTHQGFSTQQVASWHAKLVKADYHGAVITGALPVFCCVDFHLMMR